MSSDDQLRALTAAIQVFVEEVRRLPQQIAKAVATKLAEEEEEARVAEAKERVS